MKLFCESLREHVAKIINFAKKTKKKMTPLTNERQVSDETAKIYVVYKKKFESKYTNERSYRKVRDHCYVTGKYRGAVHSIFN